MRRTSLLARLLVVVVLVAGASVVGTAFLTSTTAFRFDPQKYDANQQADEHIVDDLTGYAATHTDWSDVGPLINRLSTETGRRIAIRGSLDAILYDTKPSVDPARQLHGADRPAGFWVRFARQHDERHRLPRGRPLSADRRRERRVEGTGGPGRGVHRPHRRGQLHRAAQRAAVAGFRPQRAGVRRAAARATAAVGARRSRFARRAGELLPRPQVGAPGRRRHHRLRAAGL